jgi:3-deoxy-D-manno-octulosonic-acid transferase
MEIEVWPRMIAAARKAGVPFYLCNSHYPSRSYDRDMKRFKWRAEVLSLLAGAFIKSDLQRPRFEASGVTDIAITGEMRFDQAIPAELVTAGARWKTTLDNRHVIALPSVVVGEDETYLNMINALQDTDAPLFIYIPRAPERFDETADLLQACGLKIARRSDVFDAVFNGTPPADIDVLLGDSMGEMYFYLAACDLAIIGGGFIEKGAHNVSEPLALGKPCVVGPYTHTIEFPLEEAKAAGVAYQVQSEAELIAYLQARQFPSSEKAMTFATEQKGATQRTIAALTQRGLI